MEIPEHLSSESPSTIQIERLYQEVWNMSAIESDDPGEAARNAYNEFEDEYRQAENPIEWIFSDTPRIDRTINRAQRELEKSSDLATSIQQFNELTEDKKYDGYSVYAFELNGQAVIATGRPADRRP